MTLTLIGVLIGMLLVRLTLGRRRWAVSVANGHRRGRLTYFEARRIVRCWPGGVARVVRDDA